MSAKCHDILNHFTVLLIAGLILWPARLLAEDLSQHPGYQLLVNKAYLTPDFDQETLAEIWRVWPEPDRSRAENAAVEDRWQMIDKRYGFNRRDENPALPLQYVVTDEGNWVMNCFACHGGEVAGRVIPGAPNTFYAIQTLTEEIRQIKQLQSRLLTPKDYATLFFPMGGTVGTTNAVMFGVALENYRDHDLNVVSLRPPPVLTHHDMDAPPWWHYRKKSRLYIDGFAEKHHRALVPFVLIKPNTGETVKGWEEDFKTIGQYLSEIEAPKYPYAIDGELARRGENVFIAHCADCHGTYGSNETYDPQPIPLADIGTDPVRLRALKVHHRENYGKSWLGSHGEQDTITNPGGYVPPPLDGIWASGPYFHNGSVPTLWHLLRPEERPTIWKRTERDFNQTEVGLQFETVIEVPDGISPGEKRTYFDTRQFGKSAAGHDYPALLTEQEKRELLEYLKTL